jgi:hypothetical protein
MDKLMLVKNGTQVMRVPGERLGPDPPRGRGKSIGGDLDIDDEGSKQNVETLQSLHHGSVGYQHERT